MNVNICVVTVASEEKRGYWLFRESCALFNIQPIVLGMGEAYAQNIDKIKHLQTFLEQYSSGYTHILFADAYDVIFTSGLEEISKRYYYFNSPIVFSAEKSCWPDAHRAESYPRCLTPYRFLNSGLWIGEIQSARTMIRQALDSATSFNGISDQRLYTIVYLNKTTSVVLDCNCSLFQSLKDAGDDLEINNYVPIRNKTTGSFPLIFHGNGYSSLYYVLLRFGLISHIDVSFQKSLRGSVSGNQYRHINKLICSCAHCRVLSINAGCGSEYLYHCSQGNIVFLENDCNWLPKLPCEVINPKYKGTIGKWLSEIKVPNIIAQNWDIVIVNSPFDNKFGNHGQQEYVYWASQFARQFVLVHDYQREWVRKVCDLYLGHPTEVIPFNGSDDHLLAVFKRTN